MKILEVGAGSGAMTQLCLQVLSTSSENDVTTPRYGHWDFTDISGSFFPKAQDLFASQGTRMKFKTLDIEQDPGLEGFKCETYDMVVAFLVSLRVWILYGLRVGTRSDLPDILGLACNKRSVCESEECPQVAEAV
jgi:hypothetical protein